MSRKMKDSGVAWIKQIPEKWKIGILKNALLEIKDGTHGTFQRVDDGDYLLSAKNIGDDGLVLGSNESMISHQDFLQITANGYPQKNDILMCIVGSIGRCCLFKESYPLAFQRSVAFLRCKSNYYPQYICYILRSKIAEDSETLLAHGTAQKGMYLDDVKKINILIPPLSEQHRIADFLDSKCSQIDEISKKIQEEIDTLEEYKKSVITEAVTKGLDPNVEMKYSGIEWIGEIPEDWSVIKITRMLDFTHPYPIGDGDHGLIKTDRYTDTGIPYIRVQNLGWGTDLSLDNVVYITPEDNRRIESSTLYPGDILFAKTGATIGKSGIVPPTISIANTTSHVGKLTVSKEYNPRYVYYCFASHVVFRQFWEIAGLKSTRPELSIDEIKMVRIIVPKQKVQQDEIVIYLDQKCEGIDKAIIQKQQQLSTLEEYKKSLIYEYVTGKKEVA